MATIIVDCGTAIPGESSLAVTGIDGVATTHTDKLEALGIQDIVKGSYGLSRGDASEIQLVRYRDRASPKLAEKCASGTAIGNVTVHIFKSDGGLKEILKLELKSTYVSRIEYDTADSTGVAFRKHDGGEGLGAAADAAAIQNRGNSVNDYRIYSRNRGRPAPVFGESPGAATDVEVERVWLNFSGAKWTTTGNVTGSFDNHLGKVWA